MKIRNDNNGKVIDEISNQCYFLRKLGNNNIIFFKEKSCIITNVFHLYNKKKSYLKTSNLKSGVSSSLSLYL